LKPGRAVCGIALSLLLSSSGVLADGAQSAIGPLPGLSVYNVSSQWTTEDGKPAQLESLRGRPVVAAMIYLSCPDVCPLIVENMQQIEAHLPKSASSNVRFALFSFDTVRDSPEKLKDYALARGLNLSRWSLFAGDEKAARELGAVLDVTYRKKSDGNFDHSIVISLLDSDGVVVHRQVGLQADTSEFVAEIEELDKRSGSRR